MPLVTVLSCILIHATAKSPLEPLNLTIFNCYLAPLDGGGLVKEEAFEKFFMLDLPIVLQ